MRTIGTIRTIGAIRAIRTIGTIRTIGALNPFNAFDGDPVGKRRALCVRTEFLPARCLIPAPCGLTLAVCSVTVESVSQSLIVRVLRDVPDQALVGTLHRLVCWIRIREHGRRAQSRRHADYADKCFHEIRPPCSNAGVIPGISTQWPCQGEKQADKTGNKTGFWRAKVLWHPEINKKKLREAYWRLREPKARPPCRSSRVMLTTRPTAGQGPAERQKLYARVSPAPKSGLPSAKPLTA